MPSEAAGGFIPPPAEHDLVSDGSGPSSTKSSSPLLLLTAQQERRLRTHVDGRLLQLERDARKHSFGSLSMLIPRLVSLLTLILQIPPPEPWGSLRVDYLLTFTGSIMGYITSLALIDLSRPGRRKHDKIANGNPDDDEQDADWEEKQAGVVMTQLLHFLDSVDLGWRAALRGDGWIVENGKGNSVPVAFGARVGATERIRLKNIVISGREKLLAWARTYGDFSAKAIADLAESDATGEVVSGKEVGLEWEVEVVRMWNGTLEALADLDFADPAPTR